MVSPFRFGRLALVLAAVVAAAACGVTGPSGRHAEEQARLDQARARWRGQALSDYTFVFRRGCFCVPEVREPRPSRCAAARSPRS